jgi:hypothetical protein
MTDPQIAEIADVHPYWCDCAGCWTGVTVNAQKPPSLWQRIRHSVAAYLKEQSNA